MNAPPELEPLVRGVCAGSERDVARALSLVEDSRAAFAARAVELQRRLLAQTPADRGHRIGITGPPGVGKSSLCRALVGRLRRSGQSVALLAVDPSSPRSGGALLGDRARLTLDPGDPGVFVRSMASGGQLGGLARAAGAAVIVLAAAFDAVLIETTGVGQSETDVEHVADTVVLVVQPASGDVLQFIKAGIMEVPDLFLVNKADLGQVAEVAERELRTALLAGGEAAVTPVLRVSAETDVGLDELVLALQRHRARLEESGSLIAERRRKAVRWAERLLTLRYGEFLLERSGGADEARRRLELLLQQGAVPAEAVDQLARAAGLG
ncbi:MAG: methylmalonyl Co-A mutase-associated GTPase MeaB [Polyangiaceae bacterium]|nr:methylmalonyl Co-A mutase-associated GTPase MeaB [Polyangiaceae bacterium]